MSYQTEFPTFPAADVPAVVQGEGWTDASWHNDVMPFFIHEASGVGVWCDWSDPAERENGPGSPRFVVVQLQHDATHGWQHDISGDVELVETESVEALENSLPNFTSRESQ